MSCLVDPAERFNPRKEEWMALRPRNLPCALVKWPHILVSDFLSGQSETAGGEAVLTCKPWD